MPDSGDGLDQIAQARREIALAKRDFGGFIEGDQPNVSEDQFKWLSYRMSQLDDDGTFIAMAAADDDFDATVWDLRLKDWRADPQFAAMEQIALGNKREGVRLLSVHLAGKALRQMSSLLDSRDPKIAIRALTLWSRQMGLLIDKITVMDQDTLTRLAQRMTEPSRIQVLPGPSIDGEWTEQPPQPPSAR